MNIDATVSDVPIECSLFFDAEQPWAVPLVLDGMWWTVGRSLLDNGVTVPSGVVAAGGASGDVLVRPDGGELSVTLRNRDHIAEVRLDRDQVSRFLNGTYAEVPQADEDALMAQVVSDALDRLSHRT